MTFYKYTEIKHEFLEEILIDYTINTVIFKKKNDAIDFAYTNYVQHMDNYDDVEDTNNLEYDTEGSYEVTNIDEDTGLACEFKITIEEIKLEVESEIVYTATYTNHITGSNTQSDDESLE